MAFAGITRKECLHPLRSYEQELPEGLTMNQRYARVASRIEEDYNSMFFDGRIPLGAEHGRIDYERHPERSPFRSHLAYLMRCTAKRSSLPLELQNELSDLRVAAEHCINGIITTNYDDFTEKLFPDFDVYRGQDDLFVTQATGYAEIYKIHGDYRNPEGMVFTEEDYDAFECRRAYLVSKLLSIFVENPLIILGYSLSDDNIRGIFESIAGCLCAEHLKDLGKRIIFVDYKEDVAEPSVFMRKPLERYPDFYITAIEINSFAPVFKQVLRLRRNYPLRLMRRVRQDLYRTVVTNEPQDTIRVLPECVVMDEDTGQIQTVVGFTKEEGGEHIALSTEEVYLHVLYPDKGPAIHYRSFVQDWLPKKIDSTKYPVFFYIKKYLETAGGEGVLPERVADYVASIEGVDSFLNKSLREERKPQRKFSSVKSIEENWEGERNKLDKLSLLDEEALNRGQLQRVLDRILREEGNLLHRGDASSSAARRLIRIYDYVEHANAILFSEDGRKCTLAKEGDESCRKSPSN